MKSSNDSKEPKGETLRELKLREIEYLRERFGSSPLADQLERELSDESKQKEKRVIGVVMPNSSKSPKTAE